MERITTGDCLSVFGPFGVGMDFAVRFPVRLIDKIDGDILKRAVEKTNQRYPYFSTALKKDDNSFYFEQNSAPITVRNTNSKASLNTAESNYHLYNCASNVYFAYTDQIKSYPLEKQCTVHRGTTFIQTDDQKAMGLVIGMANITRLMLKNAPTLEAKKYAFGQIFGFGSITETYMVSYIGQWKHKALNPYVRELWTHVPCVPDFTVEIAAINGKIFLSMNQAFKEDIVVRSFMRQLARYNIPFSCKQAVDSDVAHVQEPGM